MTGDVVCTNGTFKLVIDFLEVCPSGLGVSVRLIVEYGGIRQNFRWAADGVWIEYTELLKFENDLLEGPVAQLHDMSCYPLLQFEQTSSEEHLTINPQSERQSSDGEAILIRLNIGRGSIFKLQASLSQFAKWW